MRLYSRAILTTALAALLAFPALAAQDDVKATGRVDIRLGDFDIVIGDTGERYDGWDGSSTRVQVEVLDGRRAREHYFDSLPAALFVLREMYGEPRIMSLGVPEYAGARHLSHGHSGHGLLDGAQAYYLLDYDQYSRGGLPLVLAFSSYGDAMDELRYRNGEVMGFEDLVWSLYRWAERDYSRIYWRGWDNDRWDNSRWNRAYNNRWEGWGWNNDRGWLRMNINLGGDNHDRDRNQRDRENYGRDRRDREQRDRRRGAGVQRDSGRGDSERDRGERDRERGEREREHARQRDGGNGQGDADRQRERERQRDEDNNGNDRGDRERERERDSGNDGDGNGRRR